MDSSTRRPNTAFARHLLGWVALRILWTFIIVQVSGMLPAPDEQGIASGTLPVAIAAAVFAAAFVAVAQFLKEITERVPDYPPGLPLWFDVGRRVRERRLSDLQFRACEVLMPRRPEGLPTFAEWQGSEPSTVHAARHRAARRRYRRPSQSSTVQTAQPGRRPFPIPTVGLLPSVAACIPLDITSAPSVDGPGRLRDAAPERGGEGRERGAQGPRRYACPQR